MLVERLPSSERHLPDVVPSAEDAAVRTPESHPPPPRKRWTHRRLVGLVVVVVLLVTVPSLYVLSQSRLETTSYSVVVQTSCPRGVWAPPAPGELTGACNGLGWLEVSLLADVSGTWALSNDSPAAVIFTFWSQAYVNNSSTNGSFRLTGVTPYTWQSSHAPLASVGADATVTFVVLSNYPIHVTIQGSYSAPLL